MSAQLFVLLVGPQTLFSTQVQSCAHAHRGQSTALRQTVPPAILVLFTTQLLKFAQVVSQIVLLVQTPRHAVNALTTINSSAASVSATVHLTQPVGALLALQMNFTLKVSVNRV